MYQCLGSLKLLWELFLIVSPKKIHNLQSLESHYQNLTYYGNTNTACMHISNLAETT